jgi:hypothetical protein
MSPQRAAAWMIAEALGLFIGAGLAAALGVGPAWLMAIFAAACLFPPLLVLWLSDKHSQESQ